MQKIVGFKTEDGIIYDNVTSAHNHEIKIQVEELVIMEANGLLLSNYFSDFVVKNKDKLLNILEKPKL